MIATLYRVRVRTTTSLQPGDTHWKQQVVYCGYDRLKALQAYHTEEPMDEWQGYGNRVRETIIERLDAAAIEDEDLAADKWETMEAPNAEA